MMIEFTFLLTIKTTTRTMKTNNRNKEHDANEGIRMRMGIRKPGNRKQPELKAFSLKNTYRKRCLECCPFTTD